MLSKITRRVKYLILKLFFPPTGTGEDWQTARPEGAGLHHSGQGQDGQQAVQLTHGHVQRGHHRGDHDTGGLLGHNLCIREVKICAN